MWAKILNVLFEWGFFEKHHYDDIDSILRNAGFVHDIALAKIWSDKNDFLKNLQNKIRGTYRKPALVRERAKSQLRIVEKSSKAFREAINANDSLTALFSLLSVIRHLCSVPTAVLNKPLSNCRAPLYCKHDSRDLGREEYLSLIIDILGSSGFTSTMSADLLKMTESLYDNSGLPEEEIMAYKAHLEITDYLIEIGESEIAVWPLFFWILGPLNMREIQDKEIEKRVLTAFIPIQKILGLYEIRQISNRQESIAKAMAIGQEMITTF